MAQDKTLAATELTSWYRHKPGEQRHPKGSINGDEERSNPQLPSMRLVPA
jgi:hypothetical protein